MAVDTSPRSMLHAAQSALVKSAALLEAAQVAFGYHDRKPLASAANPKRRAKKRARAEVPCEVADCPQRFKTKAAARSHARAKHPQAQAA